ncbi:MAG: alpha-E domain-containing protein [Phycisphaerales bacterium]|nr:alpha-E domain-containing protein [Phycisphaerales bacterium]
MRGMLARAAENIYWLGRYLERAGNMTRFLLVTEQLSVELRGLAPGLARSLWMDLPKVYPGAIVIVDPESATEEVAKAHLRSFLLATDNQLSIAASLRSARENARVVRENLTRESFEQLNQTYHRIQTLTNQPLDTTMALCDVIKEVQMQIFGVSGAVDRTFARNEGWSFFNLGTMVERAYRTLKLLETKIPKLIDEPAAIELPIYYAHLRSMLRTVASWENYRHVFGLDLDALQVLRFLLFDQYTPSSVRACVHALQQNLISLSDSELMTVPSRMLGKLSAKLMYEEHEIMAEEKLDHTCRDLASSLMEVHESISRLYFSV